MKELVFSLKEEKAEQNNIGTKIMWTLGLISIHNSRSPNTFPRKRKSAGQDSKKGSTCT